MRILVIGGTRFIGPPVVERLMRDGREVAVFHRGQTGNAITREILGDRRRLFDHAAELLAFQPDVVIDMVAVIREDAKQLVEVFGGTVSKLVLISSMDVYAAYGRLIGKEEGAPESEQLTEESPRRTNLHPYRGAEPRKDDDPRRIMDDYDKIPIEDIILKQRRSAVLRLPMVYGPRDYQHRLHPYLKRLDDGRPILMDEATANWRTSRGFVEDIAAGIVQAATSPAHGVFNMCEPDALTEAEWVRRIAAAAGREAEIVIRPNQSLPEHLKQDSHVEHHLDVSSDKIRFELGYQESIPQEDALRKTIEWERKNQPTYDPAQFDYAAEDAALAKPSIPHSAVVAPREVYAERE